VDFLAANVRDRDHVLAIDYFGRSARRDFIALVQARPGVGWIQDCAHRLATGQEWGDWKLYSPRKLLGVPDGGILVARRGPLPSLQTAAPADFSFMLPAIARFEDESETDNDRWYAAYARQEATMQVGLQAMSRLSLAIVDACDYHAQCEARHRNFLALHHRLSAWAQFLDVDVDFAPLGYPIRTSSADAIGAELARVRVFAARHWRALPSPSNDFPKEHRLARELITLPCDDRYNEADMDRVANAVIAALSPRG
jgi:hypothetical protein